MVLPIEKRKLVYTFIDTKKILVVPLFEIALKSKSVLEITKISLKKTTRNFICVQSKEIGIFSKSRGLFSKRCPWDSFRWLRA